MSASLFSHSFTYLPASVVKRQGPDPALSFRLPTTDDWRITLIATEDLIFFLSLYNPLA